MLKKANGFFLESTIAEHIAVLYGRGTRFLCRHCYDLVYSSKDGSREDRLRRKARKIRRRLGASPNLFEPISIKPKGMYRETFERLKREEQEANTEAVGRMMAALGVRLGWP